MLSKVADGKVGNGTSKVNITVIMAIHAMGPVAVEFKHPKEDAKKVDSGLQRVFSTHEAQKFQAVEAVFRVNHPPDLSDRATIDRVNHTVRISST